MYGDVTNQITMPTRVLILHHHTGHREASDGFIDSNIIEEVNKLLCFFVGRYVFVMFNRIYFT